jgi:hypothetical protein
MSWSNWTSTARTFIPNYIYKYKKQLLKQKRNTPISDVNQTLPAHSKSLYWTIPAHTVKEFGYFHQNDNFIWENTKKYIYFQVSKFIYYLFNMYDLQLTNMIFIMLLRNITSKFAEFQDTSFCGKCVGIINLSKG